MAEVSKLSRNGYILKSDSLFLNFCIYFEFFYYVSSSHLSQSYCNLYVAQGEEQPRLRWVFYFGCFFGCFLCTGDTALAYRAIQELSEEVQSSFITCYTVLRSSEHRKQNEEQSERQSLKSAGYFYAALIWLLVVHPTPLSTSLKNMTRSRGTYKHP